MSFGTYARKVRDPRLPLWVRVSALHSAVVHYRPLGWRATLSFLEEVAGRYRANEPALMRALDLLEESRRTWQAEVRAYTETRRTAKGYGRRSPQPADPNPFRRPTGWHGPLRLAASLHALTFWRERMPLRDPRDADVQAAVDCVPGLVGIDIEPVIVPGLLECFEKFVHRRAIAIVSCRDQ
jgi:hypothetical protein